MRVRLLIFPLAALVGLSLNACAVEQTTIGPSDAGSSASAGEGGAMKVTIKAPSRVEETVSPVPSGNCAIDAMKACKIYGENTAGEGGDTKTVSLQIPEGPVISVQCRYSIRDGRLVSANAPGSAAASGVVEAFLAAHGLCAVPPGG